MANGTALHGIAAQTPSPKTLKESGKTLIHHYVGIIEAHIGDIKSMTSYLAVDGYFMKKDFIKPLLKQGLHIITKGRHDANLKYLYKGRQKGGKGRPKLYDGKVNIAAIDKRKIKCCYGDEDKEVYAGIVYCVQLKQQVLAAFIYYGQKKQPEIIIGTDIDMDAMCMCRYYGLRFQVEFLIRDAKQYAGLEDCQARDEQKLHTHFNNCHDRCVNCQSHLPFINPGGTKRQFFNGCYKNAAHEPADNKKNIFKLSFRPELQKNKTHL